MNKLCIKVILRDHEIKEGGVFFNDGRRVHDDRENGTDFEAVLDLESPDDEYILGYSICFGRVKFHSSHEHIDYLLPDFFLVADQTE